MVITNEATVGEMVGVHWSPYVHRSDIPGVESQQYARGETNRWEAVNFKITADMLDGKYHWVKLGKCHIGRDPILYTGSWWTWETLRDHYIVADGQKVDPNWYELWVSLRVEGAGFAAGSTADSRIWFDRYILRRVKP